MAGVSADGGPGDTSGGERHDGAVSALLRLTEQACAGVVLVEEMLDATQPGWDAPRKGRRAGSGPGGSLGYVRSALHTVWVNTGWMLVREHGVEAYRIPPMALRGPDGYEVWQRGPDGRDDVTTVAEWEPPSSEPDVLTPVREVRNPGERLYTLAEARQILGGCTEHRWTVEVDAGGTPVAVKCERPACDAVRAVQEH